MTFAKTVRAYRTAKALLQKQLATMVGVSRMTILNIEKGEDTRLKTARRLANVLGFSLDAITGDCPNCGGDMETQTATGHFHDPSQADGHGEITETDRVCTKCGYAEEVEPDDPEQES